MKTRWLPAAILGLGMVLASAVFGFFFWQSRIPAKTVTTVGSASRRVQADVIKWRISMARKVSPYGLAAGFSQIKKDQESFLATMQAAGLPPGEFIFQPTRADEIYGPSQQTPGPAGYWVVLSGFLASKDISAVQKVALNPELPLPEGVVLRQSDLEYYLSDPATLKRELLAAATLDARRRAEEIAKSTGNKVSYIRSARQGVFQILEPYSTDISDSGTYNTNTREKDVTVTVNAQFGLE